METDPLPLCGRVCVNGKAAKARGWLTAAIVGAAAVAMFATGNIGFDWVQLLVRGLPARVKGCTLPRLGWPFPCNA
jgi:hypothetical protein